MRVYAYLRASTNKQDANRAKAELISFCKTANLKVSAWFMEHESGATLKRPELFRLLDIAQEGDAILVEQVDRISRLNSTDWDKLKKIISDKGIRIIALDLPTSHQLVTSKDEFTSWVLSALNSMILDMLAAIARKDYEDGRRRQKQGVEKARMEGKYKGRPPDKKLRENIAVLLKTGYSYNDIVKLLLCSKSTISSVKKSLATDNP